MKSNAIADMNITHTYKDRGEISVLSKVEVQGTVTHSF